MNEIKIKNVKCAENDYVMEGPKAVIAEMEFLSDQETYYLTVYTENETEKIYSEITKSMGLSEGDKFEIIEKDGGIFLCPVIVCNKEKLDILAKKIKKLESSASKKTFSSVEDMFKDMGVNIDEL